MTRHHPHIEMAEGLLTTATVGKYGDRNRSFAKLLQSVVSAFAIACNAVRDNSMHAIAQIPDEVHGAFDQLFSEQCGKKHLVRLAIKTEAGSATTREDLKPKCRACHERDVSYIAVALPIKR